MARTREANLCAILCVRAAYRRDMEVVLADELVDFVLVLLRQEELDQQLVAVVRELVELPRSVARGAWRAASVSRVVGAAQGAWAGGVR